MVLRMSIASMVVEILEGSDATVLGRLARMPQISVFGVKDNQIVTVIEAETAHAVNEAIRQVSLIEEVIGVYPVSINERG
jgi:nitrate reductase NapAB chaperone NapD